MFNVQGSEIIIIVLVALIVLGPEKLPDAIRRVSKFYAEMRKMSTGFQSELRNALDEPMRELRDTADLVRKNADFRDVVQGTGASTPSSTNKPVTTTPAATAGSATAAASSGPATAPAPGLDPVNAAEQEAAARPEPAAAWAPPAGAEAQPAPGAPPEADPA